MFKFTVPGLGWTESLPDFRDYTPASQPVEAMLGRASEAGPSLRPEQIDLREYLPEVRDQQQLNSSSAHAALALIEYFERRVNGKTVELSPLFLYQTTRKLMRVKGDTSADLRTSLKALTCFGAPGEAFWPYDLEKVNAEPEAFLFSFAGNYKSIRYVRLDARNSSGTRTLEVVRAFLAAGFPVAFGFPVPSSITSQGDIPYRPAFDSIRGGQAVVAVGYDDRRLTATRGSLLVRNSWGRQWGENGYGWLPYRYVEEQLASDFWTLLRTEWLASGEILRPAL